MNALPSSPGMLEQVLATLQGLPAAQLAKVAEETTRAIGGQKWFPNAGPQTQAYFCLADLLLYGGQGGGGKTDLLNGLALTAHKRSLIMRRQYTDLSAIMDRAIEINGTREGFNGSPPPRLKTTDGRLIDFGAAAKVDDVQHWQGQPHDFLGLDEAVHFVELQVRFLMGWVRSTEAGQRTRTVFATNPPLDARGQWIVGMFRPWLDLTHPRPAKPGELRWFITDPDGKDMEVEGPRPVEIAGETYIPQSRTFIPASLSDNPFLARTNYRAQQDALPEPLRSAIRDGNFMAARQDAEWQVIPSAWVIAAQERWTRTPPPGVPMCAMGVDASGGGNDPMVIARRHDGWFAEMIEVPGKEIPVDRIGTYCAGLIVSYRRDDARVVVDMGGGYGGPLYEHLRGNAIDCTGHKGAAASSARTKDRQMMFANKRSEVIWRFREALDPDQPGGSPIALPADQALAADLTAPTWEAISQRGGLAVKVESKEDVTARLGRSTDRGDAVVMCWAEGLKQAHVPGGFQGGEFGGFRVKARPRVVLGHQNARRR